MSEASFWVRIDAPAPGSWNMSLDQALAEYASSSGIAVVRLYQWSEPTLSLGYFQNYAEKSNDPRLDRLACVRRSTGGGAIVHDREITYSIALPTKSSKGGDRELYLDVHRRICTWLNGLGWPAMLYADWQRSDRGFVGESSQHGADTSDHGGSDPFLCFERRSEFDLVVDGHKILGSAQRRVGNALLQHGSLLLDASPAAPQLPGLKQFGSEQDSISALALNQLAPLLIDSLAERGWKQIQFTAAPDLLQRAAMIEATSFGGDSWTRKR